MKPVVFQTIGEAYALGQKFLSAGLYDNYQIANLPVVFVQESIGKLKPSRDIWHSMPCCRAAMLP